MKQKSPRERVARHLRALGYPVEAEDIHHVQGGRWKTINDVMECWSVIITWMGKSPIEIQGGSTLTECARGIKLVKNTPESCFYGDWIAYPMKPSKS